MHLQPVFELFDNTLSGTTSDVLGLWKISPGIPPDETTTFAPHDAPASHLPSNASLWRANFPKNLNQANRALKNGRATLEKSKQIRETVPSRLVALFRDEIAFDVGATERRQPTTPERELLTLINLFQETNEAEVNFGSNVSAPGAWKKWRDASEEFQALLRRVMLSIAYAAWVETYVEDTLIARTGIGWTGDTCTIWRQGLGDELIDLHRENLTLTVASRQEIIQLLLMTVRAASQIAALLNVPGNIITVVPMIWSFLHQRIQQQT